MEHITVTELASLLNLEDIHLIDVRESGEFEAAAIEGSINLPLSTLDPQTLPLKTDQKNVFICAVGQRSAMAIQMLEETRSSDEQDLHLYNLTGGIMQWMRNGLPTV